MFPVTLPVFHHTDETAQMKELDLDYRIGDCEIKNGTFYIINAVFPFTDPDGNEYAEVVSGENIYIVNMTADQTNQTILDANPDLVMVIEEMEEEDFSNAAESTTEDNLNQQ
jgi:hypothetical protein